MDPLCDVKAIEGNHKTKCIYNYMDIGLTQIKTVGEIMNDNDGTSQPKLFTPLTIRGITFQNRIFVSPMCMYACRKQDGTMTDFHLAHYGNLGLRGASLVMVEATSVVPCGRLSPQDLGIWDDKHIEPLRRTVNLVHASGSKIGIQLGHGGRKSSTYPPYQYYEETGGKLSREWAIVPKSEGGFSDELVAPSPIPWKRVGYSVPKELTVQEISAVVQKFADAARRAVDAGFDVIEIHGAHGYLIHEFLSGNTNKRTDQYGGCLENRLRFFLEIITVVREVIPKEMPLFCRVAGTDYMKGVDQLLPDPSGWDIHQVVDLSRIAVALGVDLMDVDSGDSQMVAGSASCRCQCHGFPFFGDGSARAADHESSKGADLKIDAGGRSGQAEEVPMDKSVTPEDAPPNAPTNASTNAKDSKPEDRGLGNVYYNWDRVKRLNGLDTIYNALNYIFTDSSITHPIDTLKRKLIENYQLSSRDAARAARELQLKYNREQLNAVG